SCRDRESDLTADARGMRALHSLTEALDQARDRASVEHLVRRWAVEHVGAKEVLIEFGSREAVRPGGIEDRTTATVSNVMIVDVPADERAKLIVTWAAAERATRPQHRMLVLAGRVLGSALACLRQVEAGALVAAPLRKQCGGACAFLGTSKHALHLA